MGKNQWVVKRENEWAVRGEGNTRDTSRHRNQSEAINVAKIIAQNQKSELVIQGKDGKIREKNTYGKDSYPPKG